MIRFSGNDLIGPNARRLISDRTDSLLSGRSDQAEWSDLTSILLDRARAFHHAFADPFEREPPAIKRLSALCSSPVPPQIHKENALQARLTPASGAAFAAWGVRISGWITQEEKFLRLSIGSLAIDGQRRISDATLGVVIMTLLDQNAEVWARKLSLFNQSLVTGIPVFARPSLLAIQSMCIRRAVSISDLDDVEAAEEEAQSATMGVEILASS